MSNVFSQINAQALNVRETVPTGDDIIICLDSVIGTTVQQDPNLTVEIGLFLGNALQGSFEPVLDGSYGSNFAAGIVTGVIQNTITDTYARGTYSLAVRVTSGTGATALTKTVRLFANYILVA